MKLELSFQEKDALRTNQRETSDKSVYIKVTSLLMLSDGVSAEQVSKFLNIHLSTVYRYTKSYCSVGLSDFLAANYDGYWGNLSSVEISLLRSELKRTIYTDAKSVCVWIKDRFGVQYTSSGVVDLLNRIGFTYKKTKEEAKKLIRMNGFRVPRDF